MDKDHRRSTVCGLETESFYDAIDNDHHVWHDFGIVENTVIGEDFQNGIKAIHKYVDRAISVDDPAYRIEHRAGKVVARRTRLSNVPSGAFVTEQFQEMFEVSEQVRIFLEAEEEMQLASDISFQDPLRRSWLRPELLGADIANQFVDLIRHKAAAKDFKRRLAIRQFESNRRFRDGASLINALFAKHSRLNVVRIDLSYKSLVLATLHRIKDDFTRFLNNSRRNAIFSTTVGNIWRVEWAPSTGYHVHLMLFLDGARTPPSDGYTADQVGKYWMSITVKEGRYYNCNFHKNRYKWLGIGVISHHDQSKRDVLLNEALRYLTKKDELVKPRVPLKTKMFGTSRGPEEHSGLGRKRAT